MMTPRRPTKVPGEVVENLEWLAKYETAESHRRSEEGQRRLARIGAIIAIATSAATALAVLGATLGFKLMGPPADIAAVDQKVEALITERVAFRAAQRASDSMMLLRIVRLENTAEMNRYMLCVITRRSDPALTPPDCQTAIQSFNH